MEALDPGAVARPEYLERAPLNGRGEVEPDPYRSDRPVERGTILRRAASQRDLSGHRCPQQGEQDECRERQSHTGKRSPPFRKYIRHVSFLSDA